MQFKSSFVWRILSPIKWNISRLFQRPPNSYSLTFTQAAKVCIAEVEELVEPGQLDPDEIHLPGIYVQRIIKGKQHFALFT